MGLTLVSPDGKTVEVDTDQQAASLLAQHYKIATPDDAIAAAQAEHDASFGHGGVTGSINAVAGSALSGLTVGLSNKAFKALAGKDTWRSYAQDIADNPGLSTAGTIVGAALPALATGGATAPEEGVSLGASIAEASPAGLTSRLGAKVAGLGADSGLAGRILAHTAAGGVEGSIYGGGAYISDAALGDRDLSADGFVGAMGHGALWGGAAAGALSTGAEGLMAARRMFPRQAMTGEAVAAASADARDAIGYALNDADTIDLAAGRRLKQMRDLRAASDPAFADSMFQAELEHRGGVGPDAPPPFQMPGRTRRAIDLQLDGVPAEPDIAPPPEPTSIGTHDDLKALIEPPAHAPISDSVSELPAAPAAPPSDLEAQLLGTQSRIGAGEDLAAVSDRPVPAAKAAQKIGELERAFPGSFGGEGEAAARRVRTAFAGDVGEEDPEAFFHANAPVEARNAMRFAVPGETPPWEVGGDLESHLNARAAEIDPDIAKLARAQEQLRQSKYQMMLWTKKIGPPKLADVKAGIMEPGGFQPWNKPGPWWDEAGASSSAPSIGEAVLDHAGASDAAQAVEETIGRRTGDINEDVEEAAKVITAHEAAAAEATEALGPDAPPSAQAHAQAFREAQKAAEQGATDQTAQLADGLERWSGHIQAAEATGADAYAGRELEGGTTLGGEVRAKPGKAGKPGGILGKVADVAEVLRMMGMPLPNPAMIPVIGPLLGAYLKARVLAKAFGRFGGKVAQTAETTIASKAAQTLTRANAAVDSLVSGATMTLDRASKEVGAPAAVLAHTLFDASPDGKRAKDPKGTSVEDSYHARMDELTAALAPGAIERSVRQRVRASDPAIMTSLVAAMQRQLEFLWQKAPKPDAPPSLLDSGPRWAPGKCELAAWSRYVDACHDPAAVLERAAAGRGVSVEQAETLRTVYPALYLAAQTRLVQQRTAAKNSNKPIPFRRKMTMGALFDMPVDESLQPETAAYLQQSYQAPAPAPQPSGMMGQPTIAAPVNLGQRTMNRLDG